MFSSSPPPPGWYDNPSGAGQRLWDGRQWTRHIRIPAPEGQAAAAPARPTSAARPEPSTQQASPVAPQTSRTILQPDDRPEHTAAFPASVPPPPTQRVQLETPRLELSSRARLALAGVGLLAMLGLAVAVTTGSDGETDAGSATSSTSALVPLVGATGTGAAAVPSPAAPTVGGTTLPSPIPPGAPSTLAPASTSPATTARSPRLPSSAAGVTTAVPASTATTAPPTTRAPSTAPPTTPAPTSLPPTTATTSTTDAVRRAVRPGSFCSPEGATGFTAKDVPMICAGTDEQGIPYPDGRSRWRSP